MTAIRLWLVLMAKRLLWAGLACALGFGGYRAWQADMLTALDLAARAQSLFANKILFTKQKTTEEWNAATDRATESYRPASGNPDNERGLDRGHVVPTSAGQSGTGQGAAAVGQVFETPAPPPAKPPPLPVRLDRESTCLARAIYYEAAHDPLETRVAIAHVAMVRLAQSTPKSTMCGVVFNGKNTPLGCLFVATCRNAGAAEPSGEAWRQAQQIATDLTAGRLNALTATRQPQLTEATHFHTVGERPGWLANVNKLTQVGRFVFLGRPTAAMAAAPLVLDAAPNRVPPPTVAVTAKAEPSPDAQPSVMAVRKPLARAASVAPEAPAKPKARTGEDWMNAGQ
jgi:spore germination cell wall hydrolase CwlJ-like protein